MSQSNEQIATAFSNHQFEQTYPHLADDIVWDNIGGAKLAGNADVVDACDQATAYSATITMSFSRFRAVVGERSVVIESEATYVDGQNDTSSVASCDIHDVEDGRLARITSSNVEVT